MKSKQLANVLTKMLGLSVCIYAIPRCVSGVIVAVTEPHASSNGVEFLRIASYPIGAGVQFIIGIAIISGSRTIAGWMFKQDDE